MTLTLYFIYRTFTTIFFLMTLYQNLLLALYHNSLTSFFIDLWPYLFFDDLELTSYTCIFIDLSSFTSFTGCSLMTLTLTFILDFLLTFDLTSFTGYSLMTFLSSCLLKANWNPTSSGLTPVATRFCTPSKNTCNETQVHLSSKTLYIPNNMTN